MYALGIDFGGGAGKATLLSDQGTIAATHTVEYPTAYPRPGYAEQNPEDWFAATRESIAAILDKSGVSAGEIAAVCLDAATHTAVLTDRDFNVLRPAIYWTDSRSIEESKFLRECHGELIDRQVLHKPDTIWTLPQLLWVRKHEPEIWKNTRRILFAKDYVRHRLTGDYATDYIEAEGSMFFDYNTLSWSKELCDLVQFEIDALPKIVRPTDIVGEVTKKAADETGLRAGTPVLCGTTDTAMEVFASGAVETGQMTVKLATAGRICIVTDRAYPSPHLINYSHVVEGLWYPGTATKSCAASYRWYRDTFGGEYRELDAEAQNIEPGSQGLIFHPYLTGELTPYANPQLCGSFIGIRAGHTKAHFSRAVLEGVAFSLLDCMKTIDAIRIPHHRDATVIGGGAASPLWRSILADVLGVTLVQKEISDSSFGSAMMAGTGVGFFPDLASAVRCCSRERSRTEPDDAHGKRYAEIFPKYKAACEALSTIYPIAMG